MERRRQRLFPLRDDYVASLEGKLLNERYYDWVVGGEDDEVLKPDGSPLLVFRYRALPAAVCREAWPSLWKAATPSLHRGNRRSGLMGFWDGRVAAFTRDHPEDWKKVQPFLRCANAVYRQELPVYHAAQMAVARQTPGCVIPFTAFSTVTVNRTEVFPVHRDGNLPGSFGVMSVIEFGTYGECLLVFPKYRVAVDLRSRDVLLADVNEYHGNTAFQGEEGAYDRISTVMYYRGEASA